MRAGDGDKAIRQTRQPKTAGVRPGVSLERVITEQAQRLKVGIGNVGAEIAKGTYNFETLGKTFAKGFNGDGGAYEQVQKMMRAAGREMSVQDGDLQVLEISRALAANAVLLAPGSGLEGSPEVDEDGFMSCRARILPGIAPGYPVQTESVTSYGSGLWLVEKVRWVGDTHERDWNAELTKCSAITSG